MELIKGRWYKNLGEMKNHIGKFSGWHDIETISVSEYIYKGELRGASDCFTKAYKFAEECPLSEIQQYLPAGHPNKEFILPEKWCVLRDTKEKGGILSEWANKDSGTSLHGGCGDRNYIHSDNIDKTSSPRSGKKTLGYTEITFEEFKKYVLKQGGMDKEIIGYKLKEDCKQYEEAALKIMNANWGTPKYYVTDSWCIKALEKAGVLDLWFEPILKEKFKVGDWIVEIWKESPYFNKKAFRINSIESNVVKYNREGECGCDVKHVRLATPEEIKKTLVEEAIERGFTKGVKIKAYFPDYSPVYSSDRPYEMNDCLPEYEQHLDALRMGGSIIYHKGKWAEILPSHPRIEINGYKGEFFDDYVRFGCAKISREVFIDSNKLFKHNSESVFDYTECNRSIESITIGKGTFTKDQIKQIAEYYLNKK